MERGLAHSVEQRAERAARHEVQLRLKRLTKHEHEVMLQVITGKLNKQIAADLGISEKTIKVHRGRGMQKMRVDWWSSWRVWWKRAAPRARSLGPRAQ